MKWLESCLRLKMEKSDEKFAQYFAILFYYDKGKNAAQACEKMCAVSELR